MKATPKEVGMINETVPRFVQAGDRNESTRLRVQRQLRWPLRFHSVFRFATTPLLSDSRTASVLQIPLMNVPCRFLICLLNRFQLRLPAIPTHQIPSHMLAAATITDNTLALCILVVVVERQCIVHADPNARVEGVVTS